MNPLYQPEAFLDLAYEHKGIRKAAERDALATNAGLVNAGPIGALVARIDQWRTVRADRRAAQGAVLAAPTPFPGRVMDERTDRLAA